ncbi:MAG: phosphoribosyl-AMP cyclohydrolase [Phenylobacterium sp.]
MSGDHVQPEEGPELRLDFTKCEVLQNMGVMPVVLQEMATREVLMVGYMNEEALQISIAEGHVVLWSTSRNEIWHKGLLSGDGLIIREIRINCEQNSLLILVDKLGAGVCHTRGSDGVTRPTCFYRRLTKDGQLERLHEFDHWRSESLGPR